MAVKISGIPSFWGSNGAEHLGEDGLLLEQGGEARDERQAGLFNAARGREVSPLCHRS